MNKVIGKTSYVLQSVATGNTFEDSGWVLDPVGEETPSLVRAIYEEKQLSVKDGTLGIYKFADWLPVGRMLAGSSAPITYKSERLGKALGLSNLYVTFTGWWPERGAYNRTCSFKETEAYSVCGRLLDISKTLVVASAGNTARAFAKVCSDSRIPLILCVPEDNLDALWFDAPLNDCVRLICPKKGADYFDAINLSNLVSQLEGYITEGGAKNVARRDGMGTTMLSAATFIGRIPDYYFQAVGSGTGAIAAWEANLRLIGDGRFGDGKAKLMVSQNAPFTPMFDAWKADSRELLPMDDDDARRKVEAIVAKVLSNRKPPYAVAGGLFDAMKDAGGDFLVATNEEACAAAELFEQLEGIDIHPAPAVAVATLISEAKAGRIDKDATIMLNITGGGEKRYKREHQLFYLKPSAVFGYNPTLDEVKQALAR
jgi:cysteate synthase